MIQQIIISDDLDNTLDSVKSKLNGSRVVVFDKDDFLVDDAKSVIKEAYLTSDSNKYIILKAHKFNAASQNALLKILEEPPKNIIFIIITRHKSALLPTVRSRLPIQIDGTFSEIIELDIDISKLDLDFIYNFIQDNKRMSRDDSRIFIQSLLVKYLDLDITLSQKSLDMFSQSIKLLNLNSNVTNVLLTLLLSLYVNETI